MFPIWLQAGFWGFVAGGALLIGAAIAYFIPVSQRIIALIMAFGSGVLISALAFDLVEEAYQQGGFLSTAIGFVGGAIIYTIANLLLEKHGAKHRKRSHHQDEGDNSALAIALGALLDGIPESIAIGLSLLEGGIVNFVTVAAIFLSNLPEGLSSAAGMKKAGRTANYIFGVWGGIAIVSGISALIGYAVFDNFSQGIISATTAVAAGAILSMLADTMMPEAFETVHLFTGLITVMGFLVAFGLDKMGS